MKVAVPDDRTGMIFSGPAISNPNNHERKLKCKAAEEEDHVSYITHPRILTPGTWHRIFQVDAIAQKMMLAIIEKIAILGQQGVRNHDTRDQQEYSDKPGNY